jgi:hypothetical protein
MTRGRQPGGELGPGRLMRQAEPGINAWWTKIHLSASAGEILVEGGVLAGQADRGAHGAGVAYDVVAERRAAGTVRRLQPDGVSVRR